MHKLLENALVLSYQQCSLFVTRLASLQLHSGRVAMAGVGKMQAGKGATCVLCLVFANHGDLFQHF